MDTSSEYDQENSLKFIRKLRKKLRQIERLEKGQRELTDEEKIKLTCKHDIRSKLQVFLSTINEANTSVDSEHEDADLDLPEHEEQQSAEVTGQTSDEPSIKKLRSSHDGDGDRVKGSFKDVKPAINSAPKSEPKSDGNEQMIKPGISTTGKKGQNVRSLLRRYWRNSSFDIVELIGHNEAINCVDANENWIISGSRDTTLKLWDMTEEREIRSLGGHTGQVTSVIMLNMTESDELRKSIEPSTIEAFTDIQEKEHDKEAIVISGSTDCSVKLWLIPQGVLIKSIYNYNPVSAMEYMPEKKHVVIGSGSGNLTVYNICTNSQIYSSTIHSDLITKIKCDRDKIYTSSADGNLKIWKNTGSTAKPDKSSQNPKSKQDFSIKSCDFDIELQHAFEDHEQYVSERHIHSFGVRNKEIYFGDDGSNIKLWNPYSGQLSKLRNHKPTVPGITDYLCVLDENLLMSSSYDLDSGIGSINVRSIHEECDGAYITSFSHDGFPRLSSFAVHYNNELKYIVIGGDKLLLWKFNGPGPVSASRSLFHVRGQNIVELTKPPTDSDVQSEDESSGEDDAGKWFWQRSKPKPEKLSRSSSRHSSQSDLDSEASRSLKDESTFDTSTSSARDWCNVI